MKLGSYIFPKIIGIIFLILLLLVIYIGFFFNWNMLKGVIESKAGSATGRTIKIGGDITVAWHYSLSPTITINGAEVTNMATGTTPDMVKADKISVQIKLLSAFSRLDIPMIDVENATITAEKDKEGHANWDFGAKSDPNKKTEPPIIGDLFVKNTTITYRDPTENTDLTVVANSAQDFRKMAEAVANHQQIQESADQFINLKGEGSYKNAPFKIDFTGASVLDLADRKTPYPIKTSVNIGNTQINVEGTVLDPASLKGLDITLNIKGKNAADLFPITGIALPPTPPFSVTGKLDYADKVWKFNDFKGTIGDSDIHGDLSFDKSKQRPFFKADFVSNKLDFKDLGGLVGAPPPKKEEAELSAEQKKKIAKEEASPYVIPDTPLDISKLSAMDADVEFKGDKVISPSLPLDNFYMHVLLDDRDLKVHPVKFGTANGNVEADLDINAREEPVVIDSDFRFEKLQIARFFKSVPVGDPEYNSGLIGGAAKLKGTGKSLRQMLSTSNGDIGIGMEGGILSNVIIHVIGLDVAKSLGFLVIGDKPDRVNCIIGDFAVTHGLMQSRTLVIDTNHTNVQGEGTINLGSEKMDIVLKPHQKDATLFSLRSPITVGGTLKSPSVGIEPQNLIARTGVAVVASVVLTPFVGALAFVDPGLGKDSDCAKLLHNMDSDTGANKKGLIPKNAGSPVVKKAKK